MKEKQVKPATGRPWVPALRRNSRYWKTQAHAGRLFVDYAALSNNRCLSDQLRAFGLKRIHFHVNWRLNVGVEHALLEQQTLFSNASIVLASVLCREPSCRPQDG